jgi:hypothetical protein
MVTLVATNRNVLPQGSLPAELGPMRLPSIE